MPLLRTMARTTVIAGTANAVSHKQQQRWAGQEQAAAAAAPAAPAPVAAAAPAADDPIEKLKELAELHTAGVLTDEEFAAAKAKILGA